MFGAAEILLMQQLTMMNSTSPSYSSRSASSSPTTQQLHPNQKVMFIHVHELSGFEGDILGTAKTINAAYIRSLETIRLRLLEKSTFKETGETIEATRITMFDKETMTVSETVGELEWILNR